MYDSTFWNYLQTSASYDNTHSNRQFFLVLCYKFQLIQNKFKCWIQFISPQSEQRDRLFISLYNLKSLKIIDLVTNSECPVALSALWPSVFLCFYTPKLETYDPPSFVFLYTKIEILRPGFIKNDVLCSKFCQI